MIDINSPNFVNEFDITKGTVGVVGHGYVGTAVERFFSKKTRVLVCDKAKPELQTLDDLVRECELIFIAVPTPMEPDGRCHTGIVENVLGDIKAAATRLGRNLNSFVICNKSTVYPGFTEDMMSRHFDMRLVFSPEFLTERSSIKDFENQNRVIIGGEDEDALVVFKFFEGVVPEKIRDDKVLLVQCHPTVAEMVKLYANGILATKVLFSNEVHQACGKLGIEYEEVRALACLDGRIGAGHTRVPGPDGKLGFGGTCFPKDVNNLAHTLDELGLSSDFIRMILQRNEEIRGGRDWEELKGRAVVDGK